MGVPAFIDVRPRSDSEFDDCPEDVRRQIEEFGGRAVAGWAVWERSDAFLFTQFHMVWEAPSGVLFDISSKVDGETRVLFVTDSNLHYSGTRLRGTYLPLTDDPVVTDYIRAEEAYWDAFDRTYGADFLGVPPPNLQMAEPTVRRFLAVAALDQRYS